MKRREMKSKGEKERYKHLNAEFQRIARRDKKAFLSHQCKEIEENNRMGKTRDLFKKIRDTKGPFHAKTGSIKDRNAMDLTLENRLETDKLSHAEFCEIRNALCSAKIGEEFEKINLAATAKYGKAVND